MKPQLVPVILGGRRGVRPFDPIDLFTGGVQGAWYDPSDYSTLFQDSAGTTPVTAVEQPVGLMLDKSQGLVLGPELVTNGDFSSGSTGWTTGAGWSITGNVAEGSAASSNLTQSNVASSPAGKTYRVQLTIVTRSAGSISPQISGAIATFSSPGTYVFYLTPTSGTDATLYIPGTGFTGTIDNISVRQVSGNHASQATAASRPVLRARYNLLTYSEDYSNAVWVKSNLTRTTGIADPFGGTSATTLTASGGSGRIYIAVPVVANANYTGSFYIRRRTGTGDINWESFTVGVGALITTTGSWTRVTVTSNTPLTTAYFGIRIATAGDEIDVFAADFRPGSSAGTYQRIAAATDYATAGFLPYLAFDGTDDSFGTNSINFTATNKMSVCAGVTNFLSASTGIFAEISGDSSSVSGAFGFVTGWDAFGDYGLIRKANGTSSGTSSPVYATPNTKVFSGTIDFAGTTDATEVPVFNLNGVAVTRGTRAPADTGSGNFGNYPLYIGRRNNASLPLNGRIYQLIVCGKALSASELASTEAYVNARTGAY